MPQPEGVREVADELARAYQAAWRAVVAEQERALSDPRRAGLRRRLAATRARIERELDGLDEATREWARTRYPRAYAAGAADAAAATGQEAVWSAVHREALEQLATDTLEDLLGATRHVRQDAKRFIREAAREVLEGKLTRGRTAVDAGRELSRRMADRGISAITYRDGSRHGLAEYGQMVARTRTAEAYNIGSLNQAPDVQWWECFDGPGCGLSSHEVGPEANGMIADRDTALSYPYSHPNCRRAWGPRPDLQGLPREQADAASRSQTLEQYRDQVASDRRRTGRDNPRASGEALTERPRPRAVPREPALAGDELAGRLGRSMPPARKMEFDQRDALEAYQGAEYANVNAMLRQGALDAPERVADPYLSSRVGSLSDDVRQIDSAMSPIGVDAELWRAFGLDDLGDEAFAAAARSDPASLVGSALEDRAYLSTTTSREVAEGFLTNVQRETVLLRLDAPADTTAVWMKGVSGEYAYQNELLVSRGNRIVFTEVLEQAEGRTVMAARLEAL